MTEKTIHLSRPHQARPHQGAKRKLIGHELLLQKLKDERSSARIITMNGERLTGQITNFDKYSVTVDLENGAEFCFFKHAISGFGKEV